MGIVKGSLLGVNNAFSGSSSSSSKPTFCKHVISPVKSKLDKENTPPNRCVTATPTKSVKNRLQKLHDKLSDSLSKEADLEESPVAVSDFDEAQRHRLERVYDDIQKMESLEEPRQEIDVWLEKYNAQIDDWRVDASYVSTTLGCSKEVIDYILEQGSKVKELVDCVKVAGTGSESSSVELIAIPNDARGDMNKFVPFVQLSGNKTINIIEFDLKSTPANTNLASFLKFITDEDSPKDSKASFIFMPQVLKSSLEKVLISDSERFPQISSYKRYDTRICSKEFGEKYRDFLVDVGVSNYSCLSAVLNKVEALSDLYDMYKEIGSDPKKQLLIININTRPLSSRYSNRQARHATDMRMVAEQIKGAKDVGVPVMLVGGPMGPEDEHCLEGLKKHYVDATNLWKAPYSLGRNAQKAFLYLVVDQLEVADSCYKIGMQSGSNEPDGCFLKCLSLSEDWGSGTAGSKRVRELEAGFESQGKDGLKNWFKVFSHLLHLNTDAVYGSLALLRGGRDEGDVNYFEVKELMKDSGFLEKDVDLIKMILTENIKLQSPERNKGGGRS